MFKQLKISTRLFLSFGLIIGLMLALGIFALSEINTLSTLVTNIYKHPLVISKATRDININILKIHHSLAEMAQVTNPVPIDITLPTIHAYEQNIDDNLKLLRERFLGNPGKVEALTKMFIAWQTTREAIVTLLKQGQRNEALALIQGQCNTQVGQLEDQMKILNNFANRKADLFSEEANRQLQHAWIGISTVLLAVVIFGIVLAWVISRTLSHSVNLAVNLANEMAAGNLNNVIPIQRQDEIGQFLQALALLQTQLRERIETIEDAQQVAERISREAQEREQYWQTLVEEALIGLALFRLDGSLVNANSTFLNMIGYTAAEAFDNLTIWRLSPLQTDDSVVQLQMHYLDTYGRYGPFEKEYLHKEGHIILIQEAGLLIERQGESFIWTNVEDITAQKRLAMALHKSEIHLQESLKIAQMGTWEWNISTNEEQWSEETYTIVGLPNHLPVTHDTFKTLIHPDDCESVGQLIEQAISKQQSYQLEFRIIQPEGEIRWAQSFGKLIHDNLDNQWLVIGTVQDITERKQAEMALREREQTLSAILNATQDGIFMLALDGTIITVNPIGARRLKMTVAEMIGRCCWEFLPPEIVSRRKAMVEDTIRTQTPQVQLDERAGLWFESYYYPVLDDQQKVTQVAVFARDITQRRLAEQALQEAQERFTTVLDNLAVGVYVADMQTYQVLFANRYLQKMVNDDNLIGKFCWQIIPCGYNSHCDKCPINQLTTENQPGSVHIWELQSPITQHSFYMQDQVIHWTDGRIVRLESVTDITERKQTEEALRQSERKYRQLYEMLRDGFVTTNLAGLILQFNSAFQQMVGYSEAELYMLTSHDITVPNWHTMEDRIIHEQVLTRGYSDLYEKEYIRKDDSVFPVEIRTYLITTEENKAIGLAAFVRDITERKWAQERLRQASVYYHNLIEASLDPLVTITTDGKISDSNTATELVTGYSQNELVGSYFADYFTHPDRAMLISQKVLYSGMIRDSELEIQHRDGHIIPVLCNASVYRNEAGKVMGIFAAARDISRQKQVEIELRQAKAVAEVANRAKSNFLANMSHELRTPLNAILGYTQILNRDKTLTPKQRDGIAIIHRSGEYLLTLINDVLDLSKIEAGRLELHTTDFNLGEFIQGINELFQLRAQQKGIAYDYAALTALPMGVHGDEKRLRQILLNLLSNAIKFTDQGEVSLKLSYYNGKMLFQVEDTGIGIKPEDQQKIFLPFQQVGQRQYQLEGTGLGLPITKKLVDLMEGTLQAESFPGVGSVFWTELSLPESQVTQSSLSNLPIIIGFQSPPYRILVIDDQRENRSVIVDLLTPLGFEIIEASHGQEGLNQAISWRPDLIFLDLFMPQMTGFELATQMRRNPDLKHLPIIAMSASVFEHYQQQSLAAGCDDFLSKPIHARLLFNLLQKHLKLKWLYETAVEKIEEVKSSNVSESSSSNELVGPTAAQAAILYDLAFSEELSKVADQADQFAQLNAILLPFANQVRQLAKDFKEEQLCELIRRYVK